MIWLKRLFRRPYTFAELYEVAEPIFADPPLPVELHESFKRARADQGLSLFEMWRVTMTEHLKDTAKQVTWRSQRERLLRSVCQETWWYVLATIAGNTRNEEALTALLKGTIWEAKPNPKGFLAQRYWAAITNRASLLIVGDRLYDLEFDRVTREVDFYAALVKQTYEFDIGANDLMWDRVKRGEAKAAAGYHTMIRMLMTPFVNEQVVHFKRVEDDIAMASLDPDVWRGKLDQMEEKNAELRAVLRGIGDATEAPGGDPLNGSNTTAGEPNPPRR